MKPFRSRLNGTKQPVNGEWRPAKTSVKLISILSDVRVSVYGRVMQSVASSGLITGAWGGLACKPVRHPGHPSTRTFLQ
jgi:hypothetical protein